MITRINLKLKLLLVAVVVVAATDDSDLKEMGVGSGQREFKWPPGLPYIRLRNFYKDDLMVKKVIINGSFTDMKREDDRFYFHLRLQQNEEDASTIDLNAMTYALYVRTDSKSPINHKDEIRYLYRIPTDPKAPLNIESATPTRNYAAFKVGKEFTLSIYLQPSHILFNLDYGDDDEDSLTWQKYYGYFYEDTDGSDHRNEFSDSIFDSIHIEGDVVITQVEVKSGGPFIPTSEIPTHWKIPFKPYTSSTFKWDNLPDPDPGFPIPNSHDTTIYRFYNGRNISNTFARVLEQDEHEFLLRANTGPMSHSPSVQFRFVDLSLSDPCTIASITYDRTEDESKSMRITGLTDKNPAACGGIYSPSNTTVGQEIYAKYRSFHDKYSPSPIKPNTYFEISVRRLSSSNKNKYCIACKEYDDFNGYPRKTIQITIRAKSRIYTWYVGAYQWGALHALIITGDVIMKDVVYIT